MKMIEKVYNALLELEKRENKSISTQELSEHLELDRANVSRYLNQLVKQKKLEKIDGRPILFRSIRELWEGEGEESKRANSLDRLVGVGRSLQIPIQQAKAAIFYPPRGLHTLLLGETGVGKSMFAELMYQFAIESKMIKDEAPFVRFNCADYADNPQLVMAQIFGVKKGAYTGADKDRDGLLKKADQGILFLDEVHRLSPQGQEMLFTYIDKGVFRPLGETGKTISVETQIIAATTEEPRSYLLGTFTRRIPMTITLPSLKDRTLQERFELLGMFIKEESKRVGRSIYVNKNVLDSFLLYDCPNNIGQLRSDIQLSCAKAFLNYKADNQNYILIQQSDLPVHVKRGLLKIQDYREAIEKLLGKKEDVLRFSYLEHQQNKPTEHNEDIEYHGHFYDEIEKKLNDLKASGKDEKEINAILNIDIDSHFKQYMGNLPNRLRTDEVAKVVDIEVVDLVDKIINVAEDRLCKTYDEKVYIGLALHLQSSIERIRTGQKIYHPKLNHIRVNYADEFMAAMEVAKIIDKEFHIVTPLDEIGYLTMFLSSEPFEEDEVIEGKVGVLVIMHGNSTASSIAQVANNLVGEEHTVALDMPLSMNASDMYEVAKRKALEMYNEKGILLLVDMGSLTNFGDMIYEDTGIKIMTIDLVSTPIVLEACRKAVLGRSLEEIYNTCKEITSPRRKTIRKKEKLKKNLIITACFTGEGASERLKRIIENKISVGNHIDIIPMNILERREFLSTIDQLREENNVLALVGTVEIHIENIPFIGASDILAGDGLTYLEEIIETEENYMKIGDTLKDHLSGLDGKLVLNEVRQSVGEIESSLKRTLLDDSRMGVVIHMSFMIDKLFNGGKVTAFKNLEDYKNQYTREFMLIKQCLKNIEDVFEIHVSEHEIGYLCRMFVE